MCNFSLNLCFFLTPIIITQIHIIHKSLRQLLICTIVFHTQITVPHSLPAFCKSQNSYNHNCPPCLRQVGFSSTGNPFVKAPGKDTLVLHSLLSFSCYFLRRRLQEHKWGVLLGVIGRNETFCLSQGLILLVIMQWGRKLRTFTVAMKTSHLQVHMFCNWVKLPWLCLTERQYKRGVCLARSAEVDGEGVFPKRQHSFCRTPFWTLCFNCAVRPEDELLLRSTFFQNLDGSASTWQLSHCADEHVWAALHHVINASVTCNCWVGDNWQIMSGRGGGGVCCCPQWQRQQGDSDRQAVSLAKAPRLKNHARGRYVASRWSHVRHVTLTCPLPKRPCVSTRVTTLTCCRSTSSHSYTLGTICCFGHHAPPFISCRILQKHENKRFS